MATHIAEKELRQALVTMIAPKTDKKDITSLDILKFLLIISMLIIMYISHGIEKLVIFVVYITMPFPLLSVKRE